MRFLINFFINQPVLVNILTVLVLFLGSYSALLIQREAFPNIDFETIQISTVYPGASAEIVENLITNPLEQELLELDGIKTIQSVSTQSISLISIELDADVTTTDEAKSDASDIIDSWRDLPLEAEDPEVIALESGLFPVMTVSLSGEVEESALTKSTKNLERIIEAVPGVARVNIDGKRDYEITIEASSKKMRFYDLSLKELISAIRANNQNVPGGSIIDNSTGEEIIIRTVGELSSIKDVQNIVIRSNTMGNPLYLKDVATVKKQFAKRSIYKRTNSKPSQNLVVKKKENSDIITLSDTVKNVVKNNKNILANGVSYDFIDDRSYIVKRRIGVLTNNLVIGLILVLIILSIALPFKIAIISAFGIPFAFLAAIACLYFLGLTINIISMLGLILVVGMLVDDAVVVTENAHRVMEEGHDPKQAAIISTNQIWPPLLASVSTTMIAFVPLMSMGGITGRFIQFIPYGVLLGLAASLFECFFILPNHIAHWLKPKSKKTSKPKKKKFWRDIILNFYQRFVGYVIKFRYLMLVFFVLLIFFTVQLYKSNMRFVMFPSGTIAKFSLVIKGQPNNSLEETLAVVKSIENVVAKLPSEEMLDFTSVTGRLSSDRSRGATGSQYGQIEVYLTESNQRQRTANQIIAEIKKNAPELPEGYDLKVRKSRAGPPVGKPVSIEIRGNSYEKILSAADEIKKLLKTQVGVTDIEDTYKKGKQEIHIKVDAAMAAATGLSVRTIGQTVRSSFEGSIASSIRTLSEEIEIRVFLDEQQRKDLTSLNNLKIPNNKNQLIPLKKVATFESTSSIAAYEHQGNQRQVIVQADIDYKKNSPLKVSKAMQASIKPIQQQYPELRFLFGGENKDTQENIKELLRVISLTILGILLLLILLFKNFIQPLLITTTIPLAIIPVIWAFFLQGITISFLALVGMVALIGVIVNNAIILTSFVNDNLAAGKDYKTSIVLAAKDRIRPILLTTITTVCGIMPTAYGIGGLDPFVVPLAMSLGWGLAIGSFLVLIFYPAWLGVSGDLFKLKILLLNIFTKKPIDAK